MKNLFLVLLLFICTSSIYAQTKHKDLVKVEEILNRQATDWNNGDLEAFMQGYWKSQKLKFIGSRGITYGWQSTLDNYKKGYPDKATMGTLRFEVLQAEKQSKKVITLIGKYYLTRTSKENVEGIFLLVWRKIKGQWLIVMDQTCG